MKTAIFATFSYRKTPILKPYIEDHNMAWFYVLFRFLLKRCSMSNTYCTVQAFISQSTV